MVGPGETTEEIQWYGLGRLQRRSNGTAWGDYRGDPMVGLGETTEEIQW